MPNLAIFASGSGTNAQRIIEYFQGHNEISVKLVLCNKPGAYVITRANNLGVPVVVFNRNQCYDGKTLSGLLADAKTDFLILAGFLWLIPVDLLNAYSGRILNIHPALLPKFGGKGMFGHKVHEAVISDRETESGITIHYVNDKYDEGRIVFQARCPVFAEDSPETLANRIHELEHLYFPKIIEGEVLKTKSEK